MRRGGGMQERRTRDRRGGSRRRRDRRWRAPVAAAVLGAVLLATACGRGEDAAPKPPDTTPPSTGGAALPSAPATDADAVERGRRVYLANCTACHNNDPKLPGALGPDVAGSSRELLEARILRAEYPPGYTPKRSSRAMVALPHLAGSVDDLTAYLAQAAKR